MRARSTLSRNAASCAKEVRVLLDTPRTSDSGPIAVDGREVALLVEFPEPSAAGGVLGAPVVLVAGKSSPTGSQDGPTLGRTAG